MADRNGQVRAEAGPSISAAGRRAAQSRSIELVEEQLAQLAEEPVREVSTETDMFEGT